MNKQMVVRHPATENTNAFLWFGLNGVEAAQRAAQGYEVRCASYLQQPWEEMEKPKALIDYGNGLYLLKF